MSFFQRVANYVAHEVVTKRLAKSQTFMNAAIKTHEHVEHASKLATREGLESLRKTVTAAKANAKKKNEGKSFLDEFAEEFFRRK